MNPKRTLTHALFTAALLLLASHPALAQGGPQLVTMLDNGDSANRIDLVILGDGYTETEQGKFESDTRRVLEDVFAQEPFRTYKPLFNAHRLDVVSAESGVDHPEDRPPLERATAFDASYNCGDIERLICVDNEKVNAVLGRSARPAQRDLVLVLVNDPEYGGSGGAIAVASTHEAVIELVLHEVGHTLGFLADEYYDELTPDEPSCSSDREPMEVNSTKVTERERIKWVHWIDPSTPVPTDGETPGVPGLYEGSYYCTNDVFRPTFNSKMRSLGPPFEQINTEQLITRFYNYASPVDDAFPAKSKVKIPRSGTAEFSVTTPSLATSLTITWYVDGQVAGSGATLSLPGRTLRKGKHVVEVVVEDLTPAVRSDPEQLLVERRTWQLKVK